MIENDMAQKIKNLRLSQNLTLEQVANKVGVGKSTVRKWETGIIANMRRDKIASLAKALNTSPAYLMGWSEESEPKADKKSFIKLPYYDWAASAGKGNYLLDEGHDFEYKEFDNVPENASFALQIKGDSMMPKFADNDIVFVRTHVVVEYGQIGVFILNNESYLKQWRDGKLVSLNPKYEPIKIKEFDEFHCVGRVLGKASENDK